MQVGKTIKIANLCSVLQKNKIEELNQDKYLQLSNMKEKVRMIEILFVKLNEVDCIRLKIDVFSLLRPYEIFEWNKLFENTFIIIIFILLIFFSVIIGFLSSCDFN